MKFTANRTELLAHVRNVLKAVPNGSTVEILKGILIEADADRSAITLTGTNFEVAIQCKLNTFVDIGGSVVVDAKLFGQMLALLGDVDVSVEVIHNQTCMITSGTAQYMVATQPGKNYPKPELPFPEDAVKITNICSIVKNTIYAASKSDSKPVMKGVRLEINNGSIRACGCDGMRLMERQQKTENGGKLNLIIPAHSFGLLAGMIRNEDTLEVGIAGHNVVFTKEGLLFSAKLIYGEYIDVDKMIKAIKPEFIAIVDAGEMAKAIDSLNTVAENSSHINMVFSDSHIALSCKSENGHSQTRVNAEIGKITPPDGFHYTIGYLFDALRRLNGKVEIQLSSIGMLLIKSENDIYFQIPMLHREETEKKTDTNLKLKHSQNPITSSNAYNGIVR